MQTLIEPGDLITRSWQHFSKHVRMYADFGLWFTLLSVVNWGLMLITNSLVPGALTRGAILVLLSLPITLLVTALGAAIIDATAKTLQGKEVKERESLGVGLHKLIPFLWVSILVGVSLSFGLVLLIVPFFIFLVWFRFAQNFTVVDDVRGGNALRASKRLSAGRWGAVFLRIAMPGVFFYVLSLFVLSVMNLAIGTVMGDPGMFLGPTGSVNQMTGMQLFVTTVVPAMVNGFLTLPLLTSSDVILWLDLKRTTAQ